MPAAKRVVSTHVAVSMTKALSMLRCAAGCRWRGDKDEQHLQSTRDRLASITLSKWVPLCLLRETTQTQVIVRHAGVALP